MREKKQQRMGKNDLLKPRLLVNKNPLTTVEFYKKLLEKN